MKKVTIAIIGLLTALQVMANTNPSIHDQVLAQMQAHKAAKAVDAQAGANVDKGTIVNNQPFSKHH